MDPRPPSDLYGKRQEAEMSITIEGKSVLVTGANRGIGRELVDEALRRGARQDRAAQRTGGGR